MTEKLSFFTVDSDLSSDSDNNSDSEKDITQPESTPKTENNVPKKTESSCLPPPLKVISSAKQPEFTTKHLYNKIDWEKNKKVFEELPPKEYKPWENALPTIDSSVKSKDGIKKISMAQQTPLSHVVEKKSETAEKKGRPIDGIDAAITWSKMYENNGDMPAVKRLKPEQIGGEIGFMYTNTEVDKRAYKKAEPASFKSKEKRKRDLGQANRDKQFVEEEKRILRQNFD